MRCLVSFLLLLLAAVVQALSSAGSRLLVILDDETDRTEYKSFFGDIKTRGFEITYQTPKDESLSLFQHGEKTYDHVMLFPTKVKGLGPNLTPNLLLNYIDAGGNILLALSSSQTVPSSLVSLLAELDIALPVDRTGLVVDHFNYDATSAAEKHDVVVLPAPGKLRPGMQSYFAPEDGSPATIAFPRGVGHVLGGGPLLTPILRAPDTAYSYNPKEHGDAVDPAELFAAGRQLGLVSAVQARNSARFTIVGSVEMLADKWFDATVKKQGEAKGTPTWNREFAKRVVGWAFHEIGVLRVNSVEHRLNEPAERAEVNPKLYRVNNNVTYTISVSEYAWNKWGPYVLPETDTMQLEFSMLSPFHRLDMIPGDSTTTDESTYTVSFTVPDQHGIFNFIVNYKRPFLTNIEEKVTVSVRHMAHDEWRRSYVLPSAWPWVTGIGATVTGFLGFCAIWMYSKPTDAGSDTKKKQ